MKLLNKMKLNIGLIILFFSVAAQSQDIFTIQNEIDQTLWKPFQRAFEDLKAEDLNALYADEVLRVTPKGIDTENNFKKANFDRLNGHRKNGTKLKLDFWLDSRHTNEDTSYEVGFYNMVLTNKAGIETIYGQFHIVLKKIGGVWKITQDWDTGSINGKVISRDDFEKQLPIKFD